MSDIKDQTNVIHLYVDMISWKFTNLGCLTLTLPNYKELQAVLLHFLAVKQFLNLTDWYLDEIYLKEK